MSPPYPSSPQYNSRKNFTTAENIAAGAITKPSHTLLGEENKSSRKRRRRSSSGNNKKSAINTTTTSAVAKDFGVAACAPVIPHAVQGVEGGSITSSLQGHPDPTGVYGLAWGGVGLEGETYGRGECNLRQVMEGGDHSSYHRVYHSLFSTTSETITPLPHLPIHTLSLILETISFSYSPMEYVSLSSDIGVIPLGFLPSTFPSPSLGLLKDWIEREVRGKGYGEIDLFTKGGGGREVWTRISFSPLRRGQSSEEGVRAHHIEGVGGDESEETIVCVMERYEVEIDQHDYEPHRPKKKVGIEGANCDGSPGDGGVAGNCIAGNGVAGNGVAGSHAVEKDQERKLPTIVTVSGPSEQPSNSSNTSKQASGSGDTGTGESSTKNEARNGADNTKNITNMKSMDDIDDADNMSGVEDDDIISFLNESSRASSRVEGYDSSNSNANNSNNDSNNSNPSENVESSSALGSNANSHTTGGGGSEAGGRQESIKTSSISTKSGSCWRMNDHSTVIIGGLGVRATKEDCQNSDDLGNSGSASSCIGDGVVRNGSSLNGNKENNTLSKNKTKNLVDSHPNSMNINKGQNGKNLPYFHSPELVNTILPAIGVGTHAFLDAASRSGLSIFLTNIHGGITYYNKSFSDTTLFGPETIDTTMANKKISDLIFGAGTDIGEANGIFSFSKKTSISELTQNNRNSRILICYRKNGEGFINRLTYFPIYSENEYDKSQKSKYRLEHIVGICEELNSSKGKRWDGVGGDGVVGKMGGGRESGQNPVQVFAKIRLIDAKKIYTASLEKQKEEAPHIFLGNGDN